MYWRVENIEAVGLNDGTSGTVHKHMLSQVSSFSAIDNMHSGVWINFGGVEWNTNIGLCDGNEE